MPRGEYLPPEGIAALALRAAVVSALALPAAAVALLQTLTTSTSPARPPAAAVAVCCAGAQLILGSRSAFLSRLFPRRGLAVARALLCAAGLLSAAAIAALGGTGFGRVALAGVLCAAAILCAALPLVAGGRGKASGIERAAAARGRGLPAGSILCAASVATMGYALFASGGDAALALAAAATVAVPLAVAARNSTAAQRVKVREALREGARRVIVRVERPDGFEFAAGQHARIRAIRPGFPPRSIALSIASAPADKDLRFVVKDCGPWTSAAMELAKDDELALSGPFGRFHPPADGLPLVLIAGGIGAAPFLSILEDLASGAGDRKAALLWQCPTEEGFFMLDDVRSHSRTIPGFTFVPIATSSPLWRGESERIGPALLRRVLQDFLGAKARWMLCGPGSFNRDARRAIRAAGGRGPVQEEWFGR